MKEHIDLKSIEHHEKCTYNRNTRCYFCHKGRQSMCKVAKAKLKNAKINEINDTIQNIEYNYTRSHANGFSKETSFLITVYYELERKSELIMKIGESPGEIYAKCEGKIDKLIKLLEEMEI